MRMCMKHTIDRGCGRQAWSTQNAIFVAILARVVDLNNFVHLQFAQMPTSRNLAIFVPTTTTTTDDYFTPCACAM